MGLRASDTPRSTRRRSTAGRSRSPSPAGSCSARPRTGPRSSGAPDGASSSATATCATASVACRPSPFARSRAPSATPTQTIPIRCLVGRAASPAATDAGPVRLAPVADRRSSCSWGRSPLPRYAHAAQELDERLLKNRPCLVRHWRGHGPAMAGVPRPRGGVDQHAPAFQPAHRPRLARRVPRRRARRSRPSTRSSGRRPIEVGAAVAMWQAPTFTYGVAAERDHTEIPFLLGVTPTALPDEATDAVARCEIGSSYTGWRQRTAQALAAWSVQTPRTRGSARDRRGAPADRRRRGRAVVPAVRDGGAGRA